MKRIFILTVLILATFVATSVGGAASVRAQQARPAPQLIRDAEIENIIQEFAKPLLQAAGLSPSAVKIHLVQDNTLNAFVAGGLNLFIHTGLLMRSENAEQIIGVIAHEIGHMQGGHLLRMYDQIGAAQTTSMAAMLLGAAVGMATKRADVGTALAVGGQGTAQRSLMSFSREQESSADQAGVSLLEATGQTARGLDEFFSILGDQEILLPAQQDPYVRTHPLTRDRVAFVRHHLTTSKHTDLPTAPRYAEAHARIKAKLAGFLKPPISTLHTYGKDESLPGRYARAIAFYRQGNLDAALPMMDALIAERPDDPYFLELKGQALFENGRIVEAVAPYRAAVARLPRSALIRTSLAQALIEANDDALLPEARENLRIALNDTPTSVFAWTLLGIAYGRMGDLPRASWARAEQATLTRNLPEARFHAEKALEGLPKDAPERLRVLDLIVALDAAAGKGQGGN